MLFKSEHITQASGSIGGVTYSHNSGGMYRRARSIPVNPNSGNQSQVRAALTNLTQRWTETLTAAQRTSWNTYASNVPVTNKLGDTVNISGQNWYLAANTPRVQAGNKFTLGWSSSEIDDAPTMFDRGDFTTPTFTASEASGLSVTFDNTDAWANEDDAAMLIFQGMPKNASRNFFNGPYRLVHVIEGNSVTAPTSPRAIVAGALAANGFVIAEGQRQWLSFAVTRADGRLSTRRLVGPVAVGA